ncbi:hypothetical protein AB6A40_009287 [Gnathostoma spinigerum]|uniref:Prohormone-4 n=1 Tax=Gnathostoma spinigerum TaxID=75299 RepID=A0ABD6ERY8_9BILA
MSAYVITKKLTLLCGLASLIDAFSIINLVHAGKRSDEVACPTWHPFLCPSGDCVPIKYLCDGSPDCSDEYDENRSMCTAAIRPPVEETTSFLKALLNAHGDDFLEKLFGARAKNSLEKMGGVEKVAVALSQSPTVQSFGEEMNMSPSEVTKMAEMMEEIVSGSNAGLTSNEANDFRFFVQKLQETGFF